MALPSSGTITMNDIRAELGIPSQSPFSLNDAEDGIYVTLNPCSPSLPSSTNPASMSEWYGYDHNYVCCTCKYVTVNIDEGDIANANSNTDPNLDGKVFWKYEQCAGGGFFETSWSFAGTYIDEFCACEESIDYYGVMYYYFNDNKTLTFTSTISFTSNCAP